MTDIAVEEKSTALEAVKASTPAPRTPQGQLWADAWSLAQKIAKTEFVPKGLRDKPDAVMAAVLFGHEHDLGPMQALQHIHVVDGKTGCSAELMRAMVARAGHTVRFVEYGADKVTLQGRRSDNGDEMSITWTMEDAQRAQLTGKDPWKKYPRTMLANRATSELCRMLFPDVILGLDYVAEEIDGQIVMDEAPLVDPVSGREAQPDRIVDAEIVEPARAPRAAEEASEEIPEAEVVPDAPAAARPTEEVVKETFGEGVETVTQDADGAALAARLQITKARVLTTARKIAGDRDLPKPAKAEEVKGELLHLVELEIAA